MSDHWREESRRLILQIEQAEEEMRKLGDNVVDILQVRIERDKKKIQEIFGTSIRVVEKIEQSDD